MSDFNVDLLGDEELRNIFRNMEYSVQHKFLKKVVRDSAKPMVKEIRANTPRGATGNLYRAIGTKDGKSKRSAVVFVGPRMGGQYRGFIANILEFSKERIRRPKRSKFLSTPWGPRRYVGRLRRIEFVLPAIRRTIGVVEKGMTNSIRTILNREIKKARRTGII
jgi:hypothetical protein